jgi:hypothetical protein
MIIIIIIIIICISILDSLLVLYFALVRSKLVYASVAWNSVTITDSTKLEHITKKIFRNTFFPDVKFDYDNFWKDELC